MALSQPTQTQMTDSLPDVATRRSILEKKRGEYLALAFAADADAEAVRAQSIPEPPRTEDTAADCAVFEAALASKSAEAKAFKLKAQNYRESAETMAQMIDALWVRTSSQGEAQA